MAWTEDSYLELGAEPGNVWSVLDSLLHTYSVTHIKFKGRMKVSKFFTRSLQVAAIEVYNSAGSKCLIKFFDMRTCIGKMIHHCYSKNKIEANRAIGITFAAQQSTLCQWTLPIVFIKIEEGPGRFR